ncbi:hypothetical protein EUGRSUZ_B03233 [Eucalyptus grandis]|uniref:Uncharacterized protein n=2 Tax=Eucalyptus grandis TaxID=71139 RepID=A0ACC3LXW5_EUCGR|nr:hypothetical protein EUGRSUZ_B03233 [Eucalyptus grandis]
MAVPPPAAHDTEKINTPPLHITRTHQGFVGKKETAFLTKEHIEENVCTVYKKMSPRNVLTCIMRYGYLMRSLYILNIRDSIMCIKTSEFS